MMKYQTFRKIWVAFSLISLIASKGKCQTEESVVDIIEVEIGYEHTMILKADHTLWALGNNDFGQLGDGTNQSTAVPKKIMENVVHVSAGDYHTLILTEDSTLWATGRKLYYQLGKGGEGNYNLPVPIMDNVIDMSAGFSFSLLIKADHSLWGCGYARRGQLGELWKRNKDGLVYYPQKMMDGVKAAYASQNQNCTFILKMDNTLWGFGENSWGQLGCGDQPKSPEPMWIMNDVQSVTTGGNTLILKQDNSLWACGNNQSGQLGMIGEAGAEEILIPTLLMDDVKMMGGGRDHSVILKNDNSLWGLGYLDKTCIGKNEIGSTLFHRKTSPQKIADSVQQVFSGKYNLLYYKTDHTLWGMGDNRSGQLANDTLDDVKKTIRIRFPEPKLEDYKSVIKDIYPTKASVGDKITITGNFDPDTAGTFVQFGYGILGQIDTISHNQIVVEVPANATNGKISVWHKGAVTRSSAELTVTVDIDTMYTLEGGLVFTKADKSMWLVGRDNVRITGNSYGFLTETPTKIRNNIKIIYPASYDYLIIEKDSTLWIKGNNKLKQFGKDKEGHAWNETIKVQENVIMGASGYKHSLFLKSDHTLWGCGDNTYKQLGSVAGKWTTPVEIMKGVKAVYASEEITWIIKEDNSLWACGHLVFEGWHGKNSDPLNFFKPTLVMQDVEKVATHANSTLILQKNGTLWGIGLNSPGWLGLGGEKYVKTPKKIMDDVSSMVRSNGSTLILKKDQTLWGCGRNNYGELGTGQREIPVTHPVKVLDGVKVMTQGRMSGYYTFVLKTDQTLWYSGDSNFFLEGLDVVEFRQVSF